MRDIVRFDGGSLSMAFAPDYAQSRLFYIFYTRSNGNLRLDELRRSPAKADVATRTGRRKVIEIGHSQYSNHNGGQLQFRGASHNLFISTGDGGGDPLNSGQNRAC